MMKTQKGLEISDAHRFVSCYGCDAHPVCGTRYQCIQCDNYNLCFPCHDDSIHWHDTFVEMLKSTVIGGLASDVTEDDDNDSEWETDDE